MQFLPTFTLFLFLYPAGGVGPKWLKSLGNRKSFEYISKFGIDIGTAGLVDYVAEQNQKDDNLLGTLKKYWPRTYQWIPNSIATTDDDSPGEKRAKNVNDGGTIEGDDGALQSIYNGLPLRGGEKVSIKIKGNSDNNPGLDFTENRSFFVSSISNVIVQKKTESFTLNLVSPTAITNETSRVGKKYPTSVKISESVKTIVNENLGIEGDIDIDETQNVYGFIGNMRKPFTILTWLASKSVPELPDEGSEKPTDATAGYLFYETKSGYHFRGGRAGEIERERETERE